eukprot:10840758-Alexandrium_andersonii.AAC.1
MACPMRSIRLAARTSPPSLLRLSTLTRACGLVPPRGMTSSGGPLISSSGSPRQPAPILQLLCDPSRFPPVGGG